MKNVETWWGKNISLWGDELEEWVKFFQILMSGVMINFISII